MTSGPEIGSTATGHGGYTGTNNGRVRATLPTLDQQDFWAMELACPHCEQRFSVSAAQAGKFRVLCPRCADSFGVRLEGDGMLRATRFRLDPKHHDIPSLNPGESRSQGTLDVSLHGAEVLARGDLAHDDEAARKTVDFATPNESIRVRTGKSSTPPAHDELSTMGTLDPSQWTAPARVRKGKEA